MESVSKGTLSGRGVELGPEGHWAGWKYLPAEVMWKQKARGCCRNQCAERRLRRRAGRSRDLTAGRGREMEIEIGGDEKR